MWLSLVERCVRDAEVVGSNPVISTSFTHDFVGKRKREVDLPLFFLLLPVLRRICCIKNIFAFNMAVQRQIQR